MPVLGRVFCSLAYYDKARPGPAKCTPGVSGSKGCPLRRMASLTPQHNELTCAQMSTACPPSETVRSTQVYRELGIVADLFSLQGPKLTCWRCVQIVVVEELSANTEEHCAHLFITSLISSSTILVANFQTSAFVILFFYERLRTLDEDAAPTPAGLLDSISPPSDTCSETS